MVRYRPYPASVGKSCGAEDRTGTGHVSIPDAFIVKMLMWLDR
jgi:hypothetical protein